MADQKDPFAEINRITIAETYPSLADSMFRAEPSLVPIRPLTRKERLLRKMDAVRWYFETLWDALRGVDLYRVEDREGWE